MSDEILKWYHFLDFKKRNYYKYENPKSNISITEIEPNKMYQIYIGLPEYGNKTVILESLKDAMDYVEKGMYK